ncbi:flagellar brake protein [Coralloluteibacterium stylophorae]|uniref:flagellar brake protein n=1 Tax=Coralloluteibacterium stylophorae TaxID=1776034 RepID=UPI0030846D44
MRDAARIDALLRAMQARNCLLDAQLGGTPRTFLTAVLGIEDARLLLDVAPDPALNRLVADGGTLLCRSRLDGVQIHFGCGPVRPARHEGRDAFAVPLPEELVEVQRREYHRLEVSPVAPLTCHIDGLADNASLRADVADICAGGVGLRLPADDERFVIGTQLQTCRMRLPDEGELRFALAVRHLEPVTVRGIGMRHAGCEFLRPSGMFQRALQRYVMRLERDRLAQARGLR